MRILHVVPAFGLGGMERIICALINNTLTFHTHTILSLDGNRQASVWIKNGAAECIAFEKPPARRAFFQSLYRCVKNIYPEILMTYNWGATDAIWLGRLMKVHHIIHSEHGFNADEAKATNLKRDILRSLLYAMASRVIVVSHELKTLMKERYRLKEEKVVFIPNGIDTNYYSPDTSERQHVRGTLGFDDTHFVVGFAGRLDPVKNLGFLFDIFARCAQTYGQARLLIVGDGPEKSRLERLCQKEPFCGRVVLTGQQQHTLPYLRAMDVFLLTSLREQMPMTVLEAMAVGIPVVATRVGEIPYILDNGINGFIYSSETDPQAFVQSLSSLFLPLRKRDMGDAARQKIVSLFQEHQMIQQYHSLISSLP